MTTHCSLLLQLVLLIIFNVGLILISRSTVVIAFVVLDGFTIRCLVFMSHPSRSSQPACLSHCVLMTIKISVYIPTVNTSERIHEDLTEILNNKWEKTKNQRMVICYTRGAVQGDKSGCYLCEATPWSTNSSR